MRDIREVSWLQLLHLYQRLRKSKYASKEMAHYNPVGLNKRKIIEAFAFFVESIPDEVKEGFIIREIVQFYNYLFQDEAEWGRTGKKPEYVSLKKVNEFAHAEGTQAYIIDEMLKKGGYTVNEIARAIGSTVHRVRSHMGALAKKFSDAWEIVSQRRGRFCKYRLRERRRAKKDEKSKRLDTQTLV